MCSLWHFSTLNSTIYFSFTYLHYYNEPNSIKFCIRTKCTSICSLQNVNENWQECWKYYITIQFNTVPHTYIHTHIYKYNIFMMIMIKTNYDMYSVFMLHSIIQCRSLFLCQLLNHLQYIASQFYRALFPLEMPIKFLLHLNGNY